MANWFRIYDDHLDESRFRYALDKLTDVGWVWIGILTECCKHRSDTIKWGKEAHELFGFSDRLKVPIPTVNEAVNLLCEIKYVKRMNGHLKVLKWNDKQSDYCTRRQRGDYRKYRRVSDNIGENPKISHRGEERRGDKSRGGPRSSGTAERPCKRNRGRTVFRCQRII